MRHIDVVGNNKIILCPAEAKRLIALGLLTEGYVHGNFIITNIEVEKNTIILYIEGKEENV